MDRERKKRLQTIRLIITEIAMVIVVVALVIVLTFVAMGYNLNKDGEVGQSGLLQVRSVPTGAIVEIDGEILSTRTNTSKMLSSGEHRVKLSRNGYDSWEKTIMSESGRLLKLDYPRLFLKDRTVDIIRDYTADMALFLPSFNHELILYSMAVSDEWILLNVGDSNNISETSIKVKDLFEERKILDVEWNKNNNKLLAQTDNNGKIEWFIIDIDDIKKSVNISQAFGIDFSEVEFISNNGEKLITLEDGNLRTVMVSDRTISQILAGDVEEFMHDEKNIMYLTSNHEVKIFQEGSDDIVLARFQPEQRVHFVFGEYLSQKYIGLSVDNKISYYKGVFPTKNDSLDTMELVFEKEIAGIPDQIRVNSRSELYIAQYGNNLAVFDAELDELSEYEIESDQYYFLDDYLIATNGNGKMIVRDFDGSNRRELTNATGLGFIGKDSKTLFYLNADHGKSLILSEKISE